MVRYLATAFLICLAVGIFAPAYGSDGGTDGADDWPVPFSDSTENHADKMAPVAGFLRSGLKFTDATRDKIDALQSNNVWFKVPAWLAGKWKYFAAETTSYKDLRTGEVNNTPRASHDEAYAIWGWQKDKFGDVWEYEDSPHATISKGQFGKTYYLRQRNHFLSSSPTKFVCKQTYTYFSVDADKNAIGQTFQSQDVVTFTKKGANEIRRDTSAKIFDQDGNPVSLSTDYSLAKRAAPFRPVESRAGKPIRPLFKEFLTKSGYADLVP